ncbi:MAG: hypothetical protein F4123_11595 [Gemmatimonadetes bacterium]|nr:hypothetical protein [Gemmatimonadota bacterium]MYB96990.1 hypothetical protein [Gemmatimonadota bacterium]MYI47001.1 hypothetical protein [Gemmatimonadota bacterium]
MTLTANLLAMAALLAALAILLVVLKAAESRGHLHPESLRKGVHVGMGLVVLPLPWIFDRAWPVIVLAVLACGALVATRSIRSLRGGIGTVLGGVGRDTLGEIYFPIAVTVLFVLGRGDWLLYVVPILMLTLADAVAALVGVRYGLFQYQTSEGTKSLEGSLAFFLVAFFSAHLPLLLLTDTGRAEAVLIAAILALLVMMLEFIAWRGLDNLLIPLGAHAFLRLYQDADTRLLLAHLLAAALLVVFTLAWRRRSRLDDSALVGGALFGFTAATLGGWLWFLGPFLFFLAMSLVWPRSTDDRPHTVYDILSTTAAGMCWLFAYSVTGEAWLLVPFTGSFAAQLTLYGVARIGHRPDRGSPLRRLLGDIGLGWLVVQCPVLLIAFTSGVVVEGGWGVVGLMIDLGLGLMAVSLAGVVFYLLLPRIYGPPLREGAIKPAVAALGTVASLVAGLRWLA